MSKPKPETTKLSTKGQVIIPKDTRDRYGWEPGTEFEIREVDGCIELEPIREVPTTTLDDLAGCLPWDGPAKTLEEMDEAIRTGARLAR